VPLPKRQLHEGHADPFSLRKRSPFGPQNLTLSNVKRRNFWGALIGLWQSELCAATGHWK
jgi:hypothetical protein